MASLWDEKTGPAMSHSLFVTAPGLQSRRDIILSPTPPSCPNSLFTRPYFQVSTPQFPFTVTHGFYLHSVRFELKNVNAPYAESSRIYQPVPRNVSVFCEREGRRKGQGHRNSIQDGLEQDKALTLVHSAIVY